MAETPADPVRHTLREDAFAFLIGTAMCALGVQFITHASLVTGQTAGLAVLISYLSETSFGLVFFIVNLPFWALALARMGLRFTIRSVVAVGLLSLFADGMPTVFRIDFVAPWAAALLAGAAIGMGLLVLFRHGASLGGVGVLALFLQDRFSIQAGWTQLAFDVVLFAAAALVLDTWLVVWSLLGAVIVNLIVAVNHRHDRYIGR